LNQFYFDKLEKQEDLETNIINLTRECKDLDGEIKKQTKEEDLLHGE